MGFEQKQRSNLVLYIKRNTVNMAHFLMLKNTQITTPLFYGPAEQRHGEKLKESNERIFYCHNRFFVVLHYHKDFFVRLVIMIFDTDLQQMNYNMKSIYFWTFVCI